MKRYVSALGLLVFVGCHNQPAPRRTLRQIRLERFIANCNKSNPLWTPKQKLQLRKAVEKKRISVAKAIRSDRRMRRVRLAVSTTPEAIDASCTDALYVSVDGVVLNAQQKQVLQAICRRYSDNTISVYGSEVGIGR